MFVRFTLRPFSAIRPLKHHCNQRRVSSNPRIMAEIRETIVLNDQEKEIFNTLIQAVKASELKTTLRCAGGWVRDKLLGKESLDIDIALDDMLGKDFAEHVNKYLSSQVRSFATYGFVSVYRLAVIHSVFLPCLPALFSHSSCHQALQGLNNEQMLREKKPLEWELSCPILSRASTWRPPE